MTPAPAPAQKRLRVAFLLADQFTLSAFANFVDVLRLAADEADKSRPILCDWTDQISRVDREGFFATPLTWPGPSRQRAG